MPRERSGSRRRMVEAASRLFQERGYAVTSMADVIAASGAPRGSTYYLFPGGKEQLGIEAVDHIAADVEYQVRSLAGTVRSAPELVRALAVHVGEALERGDGPLSASLVAAIALEAAAGPEPLREACSRAYARWQRVFAELLEDWGADPERARVQALLGVAAFEGALVLARTHRSAAPVTAVLEELAVQLEREPAPSGAAGG
jgi:TetR/AcrR family transcriptional repressor of lmrAB and yxaGH operons